MSEEQNVIEDPENME